MNVVVIGLIVVLLVAAGWLYVFVRQGWTKCEAILGEENIADISTGLVDLKRRANCNIEGETDAIEPIAQDQFARTRTGMAIAYTVEKKDNDYTHHLSVSYQGQYFAESAARTLASWISYFLGVSTDRVTVLFTGNRGVRHIIFSLTEVEQNNYMRVAVTALRKEQVTREIWSKVMQNREKLIIKAVASPPLPSVPKA